MAESSRGRNGTQRDEVEAIVPWQRAVMSAGRIVVFLCLVLALAAFAAGLTGWP